MKKICTTKVFLLVCILFFETFYLYCEGTKEIKPKQGNYGDLQLKSQVSPGANFASYSGPEYERLNIHICEAGETINIGFENVADYYRVKDPNGNIVVPERAMSTAPGMIANYGQAVSGPSTVASGGYTPFIYTTTQPGDYYIEIRGNATITLFDVTVVDKNGMLRTGRLWSKAWLMNTGAATNPYSGVMYVYTNDMVTTKINFNGIQPYEFIVSANGTGTGNTGNIIADRQSVPANSTRPDFKIFLNPPDTLCYETGILGDIPSQPSITGCPGNYCINVEVTVPGLILFNIDANGIPNIQLGTSDRVIQQQVTAGKNCIKWDGKDGLGNDVSSTATVNINVQYANGLTNLPMFDAENHPNGYIVTYVRPIPNGSTANTPIPLQWDDSKITEGTAPDGKTNFAGCVSTSGCHRWLSRGTLTWGNSNTCPAPAGRECPQTINTWWYVKQKVVALTYTQYHKDVDANKNKPGKGPSNDTTVCASAPSLPINGYLEGDSSVIWSVKKGDGKIVSIDQLSTQYVFGANDKKNNNVTFLISTKGDSCPAVYDSMRVFYDPIKTLKITEPAQICSSTPQAINIVSTLANATSLTWNGGNGTASPNRTSKTFKYTPTQQELDAGTVKLIATTTDAVFKCPNIKDSVILKMLLPPTVTAPKDTIFCVSATNISISLLALHKNADSLQWSVDNVGNFTFSKDTGASMSGMIKSANTPIKLQIAAYRNGCPTATDDVSVTSSPLKSILVTDPAPICANTPKINAVTANAVNSTQLIWQTAGGAVTPNNTATTISYTPTTAEITQGFARIIVGTNEVAPLCPNVFDTTIVKLALPPTVMAPSDTTLCESKTAQTLQLKSSSTYADTITWSSNNATDTFEQLIGDSTHIVLHNNTNVNITVTASKQGCPPASDNTTISYAKAPTRTASLQPTCDTDQKLVLAAQTTLTTAGDVFVWTRNGNLGTFGQDSTLLNNTYIPSQTDLDSGAVTLRLRQVSIAKCPVQDTLLKLVITPLPKADAGKDSLFCRGTAYTQKTKQNPLWSYEWRNTPNASDPVISHTDSVPMVLNSDTDLYLTVKNALGCTTQDDAKFKVFDAPMITLPNDFCFYGATTVNATVTNKPPVGTYSWLKEQKDLLNASTSVSVASPGKYVYSYKYLQCVSADTIVATPAPVAKVPDVTSCANATGTLKADSVYKATYTWNSGSPSTSPTYQVTAVQGETNISLTITDSLGCTNSTNAKIIGVPKPAFKLISNEVCEGSTGKITLLLDDPSLESNYKINAQWKYNNKPVQPDNWKQVSFNRSGDYNVLVGIGSCVSEKLIPVNIYPNPSIDILKEHKYCFEDGDPIRLQANNQFAKYKWYGKEGLIDTTQVIDVKPYVRSVYSLAVQNQYGCKDSIPIVVNVSCPPRLYLPNIITPQTKDVNSSLNIYGAFYTEFELTIFNRWGEVIYNTNDPKAAWDGTYRGENMPIGVYPWVIRYDAEYEEYKKPGKYSLQGDVTVIR